MIVWGGAGASGYLNTGGRYDAITNVWTATNTANAPSARTVHDPVWTGSEMIVWGGYFFDGSDHFLNSGGRYNPNTNSWTATSAANAPDGRTTHTAVWTGSDMIVWGGQAGSLGYYFDTGGRYDPAADTWTPTSTGQCAGWSISSHGCVDRQRNDRVGRNTLFQYLYQHRREILRTWSSGGARQHQYARLCPDGRQRDDWRLHRSRNRTKESHYSRHWP